MLKKNEILFDYTQRFCDFFVLLGSWLISYFIRFHYISGAQEGLFNLFLKVGISFSLFSIYIFKKRNLYKPQRFSTRTKEVLTTLQANILSFISLIFILYFIAPEKVSRLHLIIHLALSTTFLISFRIVLRNTLRKLRRNGHNLRHYLLIGSGQQIESYVQSVKTYKDCGINFIGWIDSNELASNYDIQNLDQQNQTYPEVLKSKEFDQVVIGYSNQDSKKIEEFLRKYGDDTIPIQILPDLSYSTVGHTIEQFAGIPLINLNKPRLNSYDHFLKRSFDFILSFIGLIFLCPLLALIALLTKTSSPGPILFGQKRMGIDGKEFTMWKFRSMRVASKKEQTQEWSSKENPRKTKFGSFLRKSSLDELPQLWNVFVGDMSLVGPRPEQPFFVEQFRKEIPGYMLRHKMKAGITGWAQINGLRGDTSIEKRIRFDLYYIRNWSLWFDIKIIILTFFRLNQNAY